MVLLWIGLNLMSQITPNVYNEGSSDQSQPKLLPVSQVLSLTALIWQFSFKTHFNTVTQTANFLSLSSRVFVKCTEVALTPLIEIGINLSTCIDEKSPIPNYITGLGYRAWQLEQKVYKFTQCLIKFWWGNNVSFCTYLRTIRANGITPESQGSHERISMLGSLFVNFANHIRHSQTRESVTSAAVL